MSKFENKGYCGPFICLIEIWHLLIIHIGKNLTSENFK